ncbi:MAG: phosphoribosylanthranilate isomerase [Candidatus Omnitrophica bacterium]|nr:phosphoribosylanthranilate isomerase [Candidatus Omnitrophota bacterium]
MSRIKVKICGITNLEDAKASIAAGCDALGFIFFKRSPRYIPPPEARKIIKRLPTKVLKSGVFVNAREKSVKRIAGLCGLDMLQFHGNESPEFCRRFPGYRVIKVFRVKDSIDLKSISGYDVFAFLFDTYSGGRSGGTGRKFDWRMMDHLHGIKTPVFLSGGLNENNVLQAVRRVRPEWVDASSLLEISPGRKDHDKIRKFVRAAKSFPKPAAH